MTDETPKIIVDDDWKAEAQREKEAADREAREAPQPGELPEASFVELLQMLVMQATVGLGAAQDPQTGQMIPPNLPVAKHFIDLLGVLQTKTQGNLEEEEQKLLDGMLNELRMAFVQVSGVGQEPPAQPPVAE